MYKFTPVFLIGVLLVLAGTISADVVAWELYLPILIIVGLAIGFLNVVDNQEAVKFLLAYLVIVASSTSLALLPYAGGILNTFFGFLVVLIAPAALLVALKAWLKTAGSR